MPNPKTENDDFNINYTPAETAERQKRAEEAKKAAEAKMQKQLESFRQNREKWRKERLVDLKTARQALQDDLTRKLSFKEFIKRTSGVFGTFGAIWAKLTRRKKEACFSQKIHELDKLIESQEKYLHQEQEREKNLNDEITAKEASGENKENFIDKKGDLGYHEYTGKGYKFEQARGETIAKLNEEKELSGLKKSVYDRAMIDLDSRHNQYLQAKASIKKQLAGLAAEGRDAEDAAKLYENHNRAKELRGNLDNLSAEAKEDKKRLSEIEGERKKLQEKIQKLQSKIDADNPELEKRQSVYEKTVNLHDKIEAQYTKAMEAVEEGRALTVQEKRNLDKLDKQYTKVKEQLQKMSRFYKIRRQRRDAQDLDMQGLKTALEDLDSEQAEINSRTAAGEKDKAAFEKELADCESREQSYRNEYNERYDEIVFCSDQSKQYDLQIANVSKAKKNLERDILNTDVTEFLIDNEANDTVKGITINGKEYLDETELEEKGIKDPKLDSESTAKTREIQKIVRALKSRDVFKHANGLNLGEYATFNEKTGKFDLYQGDINDKESFEKYKLEFQKKYFTDSNVFTDHLIEKDWGTYAATYACAAMGAAAKGMKNLLLGGVQSIKNIPKKLSQIPGFSAFVGEYTEEELAGIGGDPLRTAETASNLGFAIKKICDVKSKLADPQMVQILAMAKVDAEIMKQVQKSILLTSEWSPNVADIGQYVVAIEQSCRIIAQNDIAKKDQLKAMKEMLKAGHERFASIMKQAANQSQIREVEGIVDLSTTAVIASAQAISGYAGTAVKLGLKAAGFAVKKIYSKVKNKQSNKEYLNDPRVLGGIDYDKKLISNDDFDKVFKSVTGINSKDDLSKALHAMDAIDLLKTARETKGKDKEVLKSMKAMGFKDVSKWNKVSVSDILKKTTGKSYDAKKAFRNASEKSGIHFGGFMQKIWQGIFGTKSGRARVNASREELMVQNREKAKIKAKGVERTFMSKGAENIYEMYKTSVSNAEKEGRPANYVVDPKTNQPFSLKEDRVKLIEYFSKSSVAKAAAHIVVGGFTAEQQANFVKTAVKDANGIAREAAGLSREAPKPVKPEEKKIKEAQNVVIV